MVIRTTSRNTGKVIHGERNLAKLKEALLETQPEKQVAKSPPPISETKSELTSMRFKPSVLKFYKSKGREWQRLVHDILEEYALKHGEDK